MYYPHQFWQACQINTNEENIASENDGFWSRGQIQDAKNVRCLGTNNMAANSSPETLYQIPNKYQTQVTKRIWKVA